MWQCLFYCHGRAPGSGYAAGEAPALRTPSQIRLSFGIVVVPVQHPTPRSFPRLPQVRSRALHKGKFSARSGSPKPPQSLSLCIYVLPASPTVTACGWHWLLTRSSDVHTRRPPLAHHQVVNRTPRVRFLKFLDRTTSCYLALALRVPVFDAMASSREELELVKKPINLLLCTQKYRCWDSRQPHVFPDVNREETAC